MLAASSLFVAGLRQEEPTTSRAGNTFRDEVSCVRGHPEEGRLPHCASLRKSFGEAGAEKKGKWCRCCGFLVWVSCRFITMSVKGLSEVDPGTHQSAIQRCPGGELEFPLPGPAPNVITAARFAIQRPARRLAAPWHPLADAKKVSPRERAARMTFNEKPHVSPKIRGKLKYHANEHSAAPCVGLIARHGSS